MSDKKITTHTGPSGNAGGGGLVWPESGPKSPEDKKRDESKKRG